MIRVGIDIVSVKRIETMKKRWGETFLQRVFTKNEIRYAQGRGFPAQHLAARFAAKEAFLKALSPDRVGKQGIPLNSIEVRLAASGRPVIKLGRRAKRAPGLGKIRQIEVSLSHTHDTAIASVILLS